MKPQSAKAKGRKLQQQVRDVLIELGTELTQDDIRSTGMGQSGVDIQFSSAAKRQWPFAVECKNKAKIAVYAWMDQAIENSKKGEIPILVIKQNHSKPMVVVDAGWFFEQWSNKNENR